MALNLLLEFNGFVPRAVFRKEMVYQSFLMAAF
jgi:hypothetical protein